MRIIDRVLIVVYVAFWTSLAKLRGFLSRNNPTECVRADEPRISYKGALVSAPIDPSPISLIGAFLCLGTLLSEARLRSGGGLGR